MTRGGPDWQGPGYRVAVVTLVPLLRAFTRRAWRGQENLPPTGGVLVVANHVSVADPTAVAYFVHAAGRRPRFLAKSTLFTTPVIGWVLSTAAQIPVQRDSRHAGKAFDAALEAVRAGECVIIYPEGTVTKDPAMWPMASKTGAARLALQTDVPVLPLAQWGAQDLLPPGAKRPRVWPRPTLQMQMGRPVQLDDLRGVPMTADVLRQATDRILDALTAQVAAMRGEPVPAERYDPRKAAADGAAG
ncbi:lysophospholipid acyltransferase family protein [Motilibacter aurantiacus]|uniref:lysophospholipid acyltransferase family protein n=1 Tax=Motilibacter aurantiacus TaxID=2714955 RepID=UPI00140911B0|nr:1-acyl-sn-glycerol-3-phosphate acyltransferase [Motilibacter aurantiacus]